MCSIGLVKEGLGGGIGRQAAAVIKLTLLGYLLSVNFYP